MNYQTKLSILTLFVFIFGQCSFSQKNEQNNPENSAIITKLLQHNELKHATVAVSVADCKTGKNLLEHNSLKSLIPASTRKLLTTAVALESFGAHFKFSTLLQHDGLIDTTTGTLHGNLYIVGNGDPTLGSRFIDENNTDSVLYQWIDVLKKQGIKTIEGQIIADQGLFSNHNTPGTWTWEDIGNYYGAAVYGLNVYDNLYKLHLQSFGHNQATKIIGQEPEIVGMTFDNQIKGSDKRGDNAYIYGGPYGLQRYCAGTITKHSSRFVIKGSIPNPAQVLVQLVTEKLAPNNIRLANKNLKHNERKTLYHTQSPVLSEIIQKTNYRSINTYAEALLLQLGVQTKNEGSYEKSIVAVEEFLGDKQINFDGVNIYDGSGLSRYNTTTAKFQTRLLVYMYQKSPNFAAFYESLPVAGKSGTLTRMFQKTAAVGKIRAKSGSVRRVRAYAGYMEAQSGKTLAFSVNINHFEGSDANAKKLLEQLMLDIYKSY